MIYHQRNRKKSKNKLVMTTVLIVVILLSLFKITFVQNIAYAIGEPLLYVGQKIVKPLSPVFNSFKTKHSLVKENDELKKRITELEVKVLSVEMLEEEIEELRNITEGEKEGKVARVITRPPNSPYDTFVIDAGFKDQVSVTDEIYVNGIRVGEVVQVHDDTSLVRLFSSSGNAVPIRIKGDIEAQAEGQGGGRFISIIPKDISIDVGDNISLPGEARAFSVVSKVEATEEDSFQGVFFNLPFNISEISFVEIVGE